ncbi:MAG: cytochrome P450 [Acidimicrobiia bacterium]|nr:cytochrome P450 [Acidimicrobiia bacterium]
MSGAQLLDRERIKELFDLRANTLSFTGGLQAIDPYPLWHELRASGPVHPGTVHELCGLEGDLFWHGLPEPDRTHFSAFSFAACDHAHRTPEVFASSPGAVDTEGDVGYESSMLAMGGVQHRRYRALVQPSFVPAKAQWWIGKWIDETVNALIDSFVDQGSAELNVDFCAAIPVLTITGSFGIDVARALDVREKLRDPSAVADIVAPIVEARRSDPQDDLLSVLAQAEVSDEDGTHRLTDAEIHSFAYLLLAAGSGTTWKQMGITLAALLTRPDLLDAVRNDRALLKSAIEESVRWEATDPMFSRWVVEDTELEGVAMPRGSVLHLCLGAGNRDPERWERPDEYDPRRSPKPAMGFGGGPHICLGMHVARAEMFVGISALLDRLPNLRLDPDAPPPELVGFYERGVTEIPVLFG